MKKLCTLLLFLSFILGANAETVTWKVDNLGWGTSRNNEKLAGQTLNINNNLSLTFSDGTNESQFVIYRLTTNDKASYIAFYANNIITINTTDAIINSVTFLMDENSDDAQTTQPTPGWKVTIGGVNYSSQSPTWTGESTSLEVQSAAKSILLGLTIEYTVIGDNTYLPANLFFTESQVGTGEAVQKVNLADNGTSAEFTTTSPNASLTATNVNYGTEESPITLNYRYQPGTKSTTNNNTKGVFSFPCAGTLYIYAYYNGSDTRNLVLEQNGETIFDEGYTGSQAITTSAGKTVYPVKSVNVSSGTATLTWPTNQVYFSGFKFVPDVPESVTEYYLVGSMTAETSEGAWEPNPSYKFQGPKSAEGQNDTAEIQYTLNVGSMSAQDSFYVVAVQDGEIVSYSDVEFNSEAADPALLSPSSVAALTAGETYKMKLDGSYLNITFTLVMSDSDASVPASLYFTGDVNGKDWNVTPGDDQTMQSGTVTGTSINLDTASDTAVAYIYVPTDENGKPEYTEVYYKVTVNNTNVQALADDRQRATITDNYFTVTLQKGNAGDILVYADDTTDTTLATFSYSVSSTGVPTAVETIGVAAEQGATFNIFGQRVDESYRGIVICNGKKFIRK